MSAPLDRVYRTCRSAIRRLLRVFFREVVVEGLENLPTDRGGLFIAGHPNGLIDPALILAAFPGHVVFGARHGLFEWPIIGTIMKRMGAVPIYRASDESSLSSAERMEANQKSLDGLARELAAGSFSALFPEGLSHDDSTLSEIKTGAARLYYRAREMQGEGAPPPAIIPVGLHYDRKNTFRSRVLVSFHPALELGPDLHITPGEDRHALRTAVKGLTNQIAQRLRVLVGETEDWEIHHLMRRAAKLIRAEMGERSGAALKKPTLSERQLAYDRIWSGYQERLASGADSLVPLRSGLSRYDRCLKLLGLEDHELGAVPRMVSPVLVGLFLAQALAVYFLFPPIVVVGLVVNIIPYYLLKVVSRKISKSRKDEATVKVLGGLILFPLAWGVAAAAAWFAHQELRVLFPSMPDVAVLVVLITVSLSIAGGFLALVYAELSAETVRSFRVRTMHRRRRALVATLLADRASLCDQLLALGDGLELPGERLPDGRLVRRTVPEQ